MSTELENAVKAAIEKEDDSHNFYQNAAKESQTSELREFFLVLAGEELKHRKVLEHLDIKHLHAVEDKRLTDISIGDSLALASLSEYARIKDVFLLAIKKEEAAIARYQIMKQDVKEAAAKKLFDKLIHEEEGHKERLLSEHKRHFSSSVITCG